MNRPTSAILLTLLGLAYTIPVVRGWNLGHFDFGDGNYMYISSRLAAGELLYRDILAPQPPVHLLLGALIQKIALFLRLPEPLFAFRFFSLIVHLATMVVVYHTTLRLLNPAPHKSIRGPEILRAAHRPAGILAAFTYMVLPLGFWWTQAYQSEPTEMLFMMAGFCLLLSHQRNRMVYAGLLFALATLTNMTAAPYALFSAGYLGVRHYRTLFWPFALALFGTLTFVVTLGELLTGAYLENVILNQVGSFPRENPLGYAFAKIVNQGAKVARLEAGWLALGLLGLLLHVRKGPRISREIATTLTFFALCSIIYTAKGGTMDYIFTIGEPFLACFVGIFLAWFLRKTLWGNLRRIRRFGLGHTSDWVTIPAILMAAFWIMIPGIGWMIQVQHQEAYELNERDTLRVVATIKRLAPQSDDLVLAPPHYAYLARRKLVENFSETYLWMIKYMNERMDQSPAKAVEVTDRIAQALERQEVRAVVFDQGLEGRIPAIRKALEANYIPEGEPIRSLNRVLQVWRPAPREP